MNQINYNRLFVFSLIHVELEEVAMLLLIQPEDLRSALLYRSLTVVVNNTGCTPSQSVDPMINCFSRDSTLGRGDSRSALMNHHGTNQRPSVVSNSTSIVGRGAVVSSFFEKINAL